MVCMDPQPPYLWLIIQSRWLQFVSRKVFVGAVRWFPEIVTDVGLGWLKNVVMVDRVHGTMQL